VEIFLILIIFLGVKDNIIEKIKFVERVSTKEFEKPIGVYPKTPNTFQVIFPSRILKARVVYSDKVKDYSIYNRFAKEMNAPKIVKISFIENSWYVKFLEWRKGITLAEIEKFQKKIPLELYERLGIYLRKLHEKKFSIGDIIMSNIGYDYDNDELFLCDDQSLNSKIIDIDKTPKLTNLKYFEQIKKGFNYK
jgi:regulatory protein YycH of two-component signal transduction system YycFG